MKKIIKIYKLRPYIFLKILVGIFLSSFLMGSIPYNDSLEQKDLYSLNCCLYDCETGRVLFGKNENEPKPMASTTKIMTCIIAIESGKLDENVCVSKYASSMPDVQLNINEGEQYRLRDLLYSLMLESHNDTAVAIAEHIGGSVDGFSKLMNDKAKELNLDDTYFITPNGLDSTKEIDGVEYKHHTTAKDLCKIMMYCIKNETFLEITRTPEYSFYDISGKRNFHVYNKNAFLNMMSGVLSGKTGFTGEAGYCYVCAYEKDGRTMTLALLGCGWPNNKTYKWHDAKLLIEYGISDFEKKRANIYDNVPERILVKEAVPGHKSNVYSELYIDKKDIFYYINKNGTDIIDVIVDVPEFVNAPTYEGTTIGTIKYYLNNDCIGVEEIKINNNISKYTYEWCFDKFFNIFLLKIT